LLHALIIFLATYILISLRRLFHIPLERPAVALLGASLMMLSGVVEPSRAFLAINLDTLLLLIGMMLIVATIETTGFFAHLAAWTVRTSSTQARLLVSISVSTAALSALVLNDAVVLFFTPIIIHAAKLLRTDPVKFLVVEAISANIGSAATQIGNPQNAYLASISGIPFVRFLSIMGPIAALCLAVAIVCFLVLYRRELRAPLARAPDVGALDAGVRNPRLLWVSLATVGLLFVGFLSSNRTGLPLSLLALSGGSLLVFFAPLLGPTSPRALFRRVDWSIILLFIGLFIVLGAVDEAGLLPTLFAGVEARLPGALTTVAGLGIVTAVVSNLISNVPAVLLLSSGVATHATETLWFTLAASSTLAGNATILGAAANIIVAERSEELNVPIYFWQFARVGLPVTAITLAIALSMIAWLT
jgi:Na+/H+ antiporter NhaD/arsenite permease-like protein